MEPFRFGVTMKVQKERRKHIIYLTDAVRMRLVAYYQATKQKPSRIIVYRDGVSEGEFKEVMLHELKGVREACKLLDASYRPRITFILVQKRHHTRLFAASPQHACGKAQNVPPGTCVDTEIVHPENFDFYLCSHFGLMGTSRPTKYVVLHDDSNMSADDVQNVTYSLCHVYARCDRSVSIPAPVYYAHLACQRARYHLAHKLGDAGSDSASAVSGDERTQSSLPEQELATAVTVREGFDSRMYFV